MKHFCLYDLKQAGIIIEGPTGAEYFNFTGGSAASTARAEGMFVPLSNCPLEDIPEAALHTKLQQVFLSQPENHTTLLPESIADINHLLMEISSSDVYQVNINRAAESQLGWLYVTVIPQGDYSHFAGCDEFDGVLTWPNLIS